MKHGKQKTFRKALISSLFCLASLHATTGYSATAESFKTTEYKLGWQLNAIHAADAYARGFTGKGQIVAVFDSGINRTHNDFVGRLADGGFDAVNGTAGVSSDVNGHGSFVSGLVAAAKNSQGMHGVAYEAKLIPIRIVNSDGSITVSDSNLAAGIRYATSHGAGVFNNSWNSSAHISSFSRGDLEGWMANSLSAWGAAINAKRVVVFAAGNEGQSEPGLYAALPTLFPELKAGWISAVATDATGKIASYSNRCGATAAWCLAAPGSAVKSTMRNSNTAWGTGSGTSFASPVIAGAAAVLKQQWPSLTASAITKILFQTANKSGIYANKAIYGNGLLDLEKATRPVGTASIPQKTSSTTKTSTPITSSGVTLGRGFGAAKGAELPSMIVLDDYNRDFAVDTGSMFQNAGASFDSVGALHSFGDAFETNTIGQTTFGFSTSADNTTTIGNAPLDGAKAFVETPMAGTTVTASFNINPSAVFGMAPRDVSFDNKLVDGDAINNPYMTLAKNPITVAAKANLTNDVWVKGGSFFGEQKTENNAPITTGQDPNFNNHVGHVFGAVAELGSKLGTKNSGIAFTGGFVSEENAMLGSTSSGATKLADSTTTTFVGISANFDMGHGLNAFGGFEMGMSDVNSASNSMVEKVSGLASESFHVGIVKTGVAGKNDKFGFVVSEPMHVNSGNASLNYASSQDAHGNIHYTHANMDISASAREIDMQAFYTTEVNDNAKFSAGMMLRENAGNVEGQHEAVAMARYKMSF